MNIVLKKYKWNYDNLQLKLNIVLMHNRLQPLFCGFRGWDLVLMVDNVVGLGEDSTWTRNILERQNGFGKDNSWSHSFTAMARFYTYSNFNLLGSILVMCKQKVRSKHDHSTKRQGFHQDNMPWICIIHILDILKDKYLPI